MYLGIEIGGTKLQLGVGDGQSNRLVALKRFDVNQSQGAMGILGQIDSGVTALRQKHAVDRIGIGFGGPIDVVAGRVIKSHQIEGWDDFAIVDWCRAQFNLPIALGNDCDCATLAESQIGAGRAYRSVFFLTVGTGIGGGFALDGQLMGSDRLGGVRPAIAEIGHLRPGPQSDRSEMTVESISSGPGIVNNARARIAGIVAGSIEEIRNPAPFVKSQMELRLHNATESDHEYVNDLLSRCENDLNQLTGKIISQAAHEGNKIAQSAIDHGISVLGWAIAQVVTLLAPQVIVVGGGVSLMGEQQFFAPLRQQISKYVFPVLKDSYNVTPAALEEEVVVHGAILLAKQ